MKSAARLSIEFGAMAPPLAAQLASHGVDVAQVQLCQRFADSIALLKIHGLLTDAEGERARLRLFKMIAKKAVAPPSPGGTGEEGER